MVACLRNMEEGRFVIPDSWYDSHSNILAISLQSVKIFAESARNNFMRRSHSEL